MQKMKGYKQYFEVDGEKLDGSKELLSADTPITTDGIELHPSRRSRQSIYAAFDSLNDGSVEIKIEILIPDGDPDTNTDWVEIYKKYPYEIDQENIFFPTLFDIDTDVIRLRIDSLPIDTTPTICVFRRF